MKNYRNYKHVASSHVGTPVLEPAPSATPSLRGAFRTVSASDANRRAAAPLGFSDLTRRAPLRREPLTPRESSAHDRYVKHAVVANRLGRREFFIYIDPELRNSDDTSTK